MKIAKADECVGSGLICRSFHPKCVRMHSMTSLARRLAMDWSGCQVVEQVPGKVSGQWIVKGTRILADGVLENADAGYTPEELAAEIYEGLPVDRARELLSYAKRRRAPHPA
jgi:uncharacterized protein (DUF433 family)